MVYINTLIGGSITIGSSGSSLPTAPNGKVLYKTSADGEWLETIANIDENGAFNGFSESESAVEVIIPSKDINGNNVTSIGDYVFYHCSQLTSVTIPDSVTSIGDSAFYECNGLTGVTIPDGVTSIDGSAFYYCSSLTSVTIPDGVTSIGYHAFIGCSGLTSVTIPDSVTSIGEDAFYDCGITSVTFEGKNKSTVQGMSNYPFGLNHASENGVTIHCSDGDIPLSYES